MHISRLIPVFMLIFFYGSWVTGQVADKTPNSLEDVQSMAGDSLKVIAWYKLGRSLITVDTGRSLAYMDSAIALAERIRYTFGKAKAYHEKGNTYYDLGLLSDGLTNYRKAQELYQKLNKPKYEARILHNIALVKRNQGDLDESLDLLFQSLEIKLKGADTATIANSYSTIGETYAIMGIVDQAEIYFDKALKKHHAKGELLSENSVTLNIGGFYSEQGRYDEALVYVDRAKAYFEKNGPARELARSYYILGGIHLAKSELDESEEDYLKAKEYYDSLGAGIRSIGCLIHLSEIASLKGEMIKATEIAMNALALSRSFGTLKQSAAALFQLYEIAKKQQDYRGALDYRERYESLQDTIDTEETLTRIAEIEKDFKGRLREKEMAELTARNAVNELKVKRQRNLQYGLVAFAILLVIVAVLLYNQYRIKKRNHDVLIEKNAIIQDSLHEKEILLREIHHRVKNNMQFISSLLNLQARHVRDEDTLRVLQDGKNRINSLALLHQKLYQEDNLTGVDMASYINNLLASLMHAYRITSTNVTLDTDIAELKLDIDTAMPIGLILNELITNALKYAFMDRAKGRLRLSLKEKSGVLKLTVADDGPGLPADFNIEESNQFGYQLIRSLLEKLKGEIAIRNENGTSISITIHNYHKV